MLYAKIWKFGKKNVYPNYQKLYWYQSNCYNLIPDFLFPVNKIDLENSKKKIVSYKCMKLPNVYSEAVAFENFLKD